MKNFNYFILTVAALQLGAAVQFLYKGNLKMSCYWAIIAAANAVGSTLK